MKLFFTAVLIIAFNSIYSKTPNKEYRFNLSIGPTLFLDNEDNYNNTLGAGFQFSTIKNQFSCFEFLGGTNAGPLHGSSRHFKSLNILYGLKFGEDFNFSISTGITFGEMQKGYLTQKNQKYIGIPIEFRFKKISIYRNINSADYDYIGLKIIGSIAKIKKRNK